MANKEGIMIRKKSTLFKTIAQENKIEDAPLCVGHALNWVTFQFGNIIDAELAQLDHYKHVATQKKTTLFSREFCIQNKLLLQRAIVFQDNSNSLGDGGYLVYFKLECIDQKKTTLNHVDAFRIKDNEVIDHNTHQGFEKTSIEDYIEIKKEQLLSRQINMREAYFYKVKTENK